MAWPFRCGRWDGTCGAGGFTPQKPARRAYEQDPAVVRGTGQRFRCNVISSLTNQGVLRFRVFQENFNGEVFIDFLRRLVRDRGRKVYLIVDRHPVHASKKVRRWVERHQAEIRLVYLPPYSPELNPGEFLNQDVKTNAAGRWRPKNERQMMGNLRSYLHAQALDHLELDNQTSS